MDDFLCPNCAHSDVTGGRCPNCGEMMEALRVEDDQGKIKRNAADEQDTLREPLEEEDFEEDHE